MVKTLKRTNKKGFTLVELVIVIAILAILAAIAIPTVSNVIGTANTNVDAANAQTVELALKSADAEITAGTWDGIIGATTYTHETLKVADALKHEGISTLPTAKANSATWRYSAGKVVLNVAPTASGSIVGTVFDGTAIVKTVIAA